MFTKITQGPQIQQQAAAAFHLRLAFNFYASMGGMARSEQRFFPREPTPEDCLGAFQCGEGVCVPALDTQSEVLLLCTQLEVLTALHALPPRGQRGVWEVTLPDPLFTTRFDSAYNISTRARLVTTAIPPPAATTAGAAVVITAGALTAEAI